MLIIFSQHYQQQSLLELAYVNKGLCLIFHEQRRLFVCVSEGTRVFLRRRHLLFMKSRLNVIRSFSRRYWTCSAVYNNTSLCATSMFEQRQWNVQTKAQSLDSLLLDRYFVLHDFKERFQAVASQSTKAGCAYFS